MIIRALTAFFGAGVLPLSKFILFEILPPSMRGYILVKYFPLLFQNFKFNLLKLFFYFFIDTLK